MESRLSVLETTCTESKLKITELENSRSFDSHILDEVKNKQSHFDDQLKQERAKVESLTDECEKLRSVREDILDLQARSMRDNLLFMGFPECETVESRKNENCTKIIFDFCHDVLKIPDAHESIKIERAHRLGKFNRNKSRPIVVKFNHFPDKMSVKSRAYEHLKGSDYRVVEQLPKGIQDRRRILGESMKKARDAGKTASLSYDKLYIDGKVYTVDNITSSGFA